MIIMIIMFLSDDMYGNVYVDKLVRFTVTETFITVNNAAINKPVV